MEIYSMYGVGIPTERAYVYKLTPQTECYIPFHIDNTAGDTNSHVCLKDGVYTVDGDETVLALSAGFMCAKGWRGKTRFNPSGIKTYVREYDHNPPSNLLEGRGTESRAHVDILGNFQLLEDVLRVATGASGEDLEKDNNGLLVLDDDCKETESRVSGMDGDNELVDNVTVETVEESFEAENKLVDDVRCDEAN
uniref:Phospholipid:diacylglycerol acyltransferase n=1 Tax=Tanacetum cinerariifolium TaxID=118510 RepID=A0A6L2L2N8_TANCI|nr:phospholipid:diacylglycerol acyltransferase [Tanacetum cinerariifolium]